MKTFDHYYEIAIAQPRREAAHKRKINLYSAILIVIAVLNIIIKIIQLTF